jgi:asparagine synthase (glutamine-hydrolysing)
MAEYPVREVVDLVPESAQFVTNMTVEEARAAVASGDASRVAAIAGDFALFGRDGIRVRMARSLSRPLRYFLAKGPDGPVLIVAERIDAIAAELSRRGWSTQFHPSYTRMVPAHHVLSIDLVGCPDPNPAVERFFTPARAAYRGNVAELGRRYAEAALSEIDAWLSRIGPREPIGAAFSGGIDSGAVFVLLEHALRSRGDSPARLKAFTLSVDGAGADALQAREFLERLGMSLYLETIEVPRASLSPEEAVRIVEDYKPLDIEAATMALALGRGIRARYPEWKHLADGEGGDENFKDYPLEAGGEVTIRSVLSNPLLYQEGWGVGAVKHSLTYTGGLSRSITRSYATAVASGFQPFSPLTRPAVVRAAEGIPFIELTGWDEDRLYRLKGEIVAAGVRAVTGREMPVFPKRRFQDGAAGTGAAALAPVPEARYREVLASSFA